MKNEAIFISVKEALEIIQKAEGEEIISPKASEWLMTEIEQAGDLSKYKKPKLY